MGMFLKIIKICIHFLIWKLLQVIFKIFRYKLWEMKGINNSIKALQNDGSQTTIHILKIIGRYKNCVHNSVSDKEDFIAVHYQFSTMDYLWKRNVTLYCVTEKEAIFVETEKDIDVFSSKQGSFMKVLQFDKALFVIIVPLEVFI